MPDWVSAKRGSPPELPAAHRMEVGCLIGGSQGPQVVWAVVTSVISASWRLGPHVASEC